MIGKNCLRCLSESYADGVIRAETHSFHDLWSMTFVCFDRCSDLTLPCSFSGFRVQNTTEALAVNLEKFTKKIKSIPLDAPI